MEDELVENLMNALRDCNSALWKLEAVSQKTFSPTSSKEGSGGERRRIRPDPIPVSKETAKHPFEQQLWVAIWKW